MKSWATGEKTFGGSPVEKLLPTQVVPSGRISVNLNSADVVSEI